MPIRGDPMPSQTPGSQSALREANQRRLVRAIRAAGIVVVAPTSSGGRRAQAVSLARDTGLAIGVHVSGSHLRAAICDMAYEVLAEEQIAYDVTQSPERGLRRAEWLVSTLLRQARVDRTKIKGIGVALPGPLDPDGRLAAGPPTGRR